MKLREKQKAIALRTKGMAMGEIAQVLGVAKSSVSNWVGEIKLTKQQRAQLNRNSHSVNVIEKRRLARIENTKQRRRQTMHKAAREVVNLSKESLWCVGVALYWGEGGKTQQTVRLANSDPEIIKIIMRFFEKYSGVTKDKFRGHVHTFSHQNADAAVVYWSKISGISKNKFYKTYVKKSSASKNKRNTLPYGTLQVYIHDTNFFFRMMGWIEEIKNIK